MLKLALLQNKINCDFMFCPCGSRSNFNQCCEPYITQISQPINAEQLMRSRFSAYAVNNAEYILRTYAKTKQAEHSLIDIEQWAKENIWLKLTVHNSQLQEPTSFVEFSAFYVHNNVLIELREKSRFIKEGSQWRYIDGDILVHEKVKRLTRNDTCPCESGLKFKKCCLLKQK